MARRSADTNEGRQQQAGPAALEAAARRIDLAGKEREGYRRKAKAETWQEEAWSFFDLVPEIKQATYFLANTCSLIRIFIAHQPDPEQDPTQAPPDMAGVFEATDLLDRLEQGSADGLAGLLRETIINHKIAGECWLAGTPEVAPVAPSLERPEGEPGRAESWEVRSVSEVFTKGSGKSLRYYYRDEPKDTEGKPFPVPDPETGEGGALLLRVWLRHPEFGELADCVFRSMLGLCEELLILTRAVKATGRSRLAGAGVVLVSNDLEGVAPPQSAQEPAGETKRAPTFGERLLEAMTTPIADEGDASAVVPLIVRGPTEALKEFRHVTFDRPLDATMLEQRKEIIQRLVESADIPVEIVVGLRNVNHWSSFLIDQSTWTRYGHPAVRTAIDAWTAGLLRPALEEAGVSPEAASRLRVWFDPAEAVTQPDRSANVIAAFDRFGLSWDALRTYLQLSDSDAPDEAEIARRIEIAIAMKGQAGADGGGAGPGGVGDGSGQGPPNEGVPPPSPTAQTIQRVLAALLAGEPGDNGRGKPALAAASEHARASLGRRLMEIDRRLRSGLQEAADAAMMRALDKAGARVRNRAKKVGALASAVSALAAHEVAARLGPTTVQSLGLAETDLLEGSFAELEPRFMQKTSAAQQQTLDLLAAEYDLDEGELRSLAAQQQRDRSEAWAWLAVALTTLAAQRLYQPQPEQPPAGEFDVSALVEPGLIREAMARAGGGPEGGVGPPQGGVALGQLVRDVWARHGQVVSGWEWVYGDPSSRTTPFESHLALDAQTFPTWDDPILANDEGWPDVDFFRPGDHAWCFPAGVEVSGPAPRGATLRWYEGEMIEISLASGQLLPTTPNHPILTRRGWVAAGLLEEGDEVFHCAEAEGVTALVPDDHQVPALIEDVVAALGVAPGVHARGVPVPAEQFHGDGVGSEVAVVWTDRLLGHGDDSALSEPSAETPFSLRDTSPQSLPGSSSSAVSIEGVGVSSLGLVARQGKGFPFRGGELGHPSPLRVAGSAADESGGVETPIDRPPSDIESSSQREDGLSFFVEAAQKGWVDFDKVVGLRATAAACHVFNLQTSGGWYLANGTVVHNCQCDFQPAGPAPLGGAEEETDAGVPAEA